jgi:superoxide dismutase
MPNLRQSLPYSYEALVPAIDEMSTRAVHDKHRAGLVVHRPSRRQSRAI